MSKYLIDGTTNSHTEQNSGPYLDDKFWPNWDRDLKNLKDVLIKHEHEGTPFSVLRVSHSEFIALEAGTSQRPQGGNFQGRHSSGNTLSHELLLKFLKSIDGADRLSTQIGWDFLHWAGRVANILDTYKSNPHATEWPNMTHYTSLDMVVDIPMDMIYGLCANRWFFRTFKNKIGLIGAGPKLDVIKKLMDYEEYQEYLGCDYFTDYIRLPQRQALDDTGLEDMVRKGVSQSTCSVFLVGCGVSKLKFWHLLKDTRNCVFIDIGHGIDLIAGHGELDRPYCGSWINYKVGSEETFGEVDEMGGASSRGVYKLLNR
tara:strand:+ start:130 stop:1074 length:945 start_codon:yes stop_codon:yes gene_type:complete